jgi:hypothetical protein
MSEALNRLHLGYCGGIDLAPAENRRSRVLIV